MTDGSGRAGTRRRAERRGGTKVLVAFGGFDEPGRECRTGELVLPSRWCGRADCTCLDEFHGVASHGTAAAARVQLLVGVPRVLAMAQITTAMQAEGFDDPDDAAAAFLDEVDSIEEGRLVRREEGILLPFPAAARLVGLHTIRYHLDDPP